MPPQDVGRGREENLSRSRAACRPPQSAVAPPLASWAPGSAALREEESFRFRAGVPGPTPATARLLQTTGGPAQLHSTQQNSRGPVPGVSQWWQQLFAIKTRDSAVPSASPCLGPV